MTNLTNNESLALDAIVNICSNDYCATVTDIAKDMGISKDSAKGIVGSLAKKEMIVCESDQRSSKVVYDIFPINEQGEILSFGEWA